MLSNTTNGLEDSVNGQKNVYTNTEASTSDERIITPPVRANRGRKHSLITNDPKNALPQLTFLVMADNDNANEGSSSEASTHCDSPITTFQASPLFSFHSVEEEGEHSVQSSSMHHTLEDLDSSVSSLNSLSRSSTGSEQSVSSECFSLNCSTTTSSSSSTSLAILSKQKYDCEAAWKLRSALRDDASKIFQATWQEAERQKPILKKLAGSLKSMLV
ncbi:uncharacterized protein FA14DRAFT_92944 [Meira miltonrushii]|uniref:Uncharacterized protein n=1 Tax=Meira miltonrushii TaxID=1280837 RepID=A0A316V8G3_9BASI|nr:uncharacterized protein FA14DRAFT_92944 [Meira miltonrushii]PWN31765.1 hypothetical protein FA14DRAFT_92944 [Meira miltonrushii]